MGLISGGSKVPKVRASVEKRRNVGDMNDYLDVNVRSNEFNRNLVHNAS